MTGGIALQDKISLDSIFAGGIWGESEIFDALGAGTPWEFNLQSKSLGYSTGTLYTPLRPLKGVNLCKSPIEGG